MLFEIGTEELPPGLINNLCTQIKENIKKGLTENDINISENQIKTFNTPRRLAVYIQDLPLLQEKKETEVKGPDKTKAFDNNGNPTQAAIGFAKKYNLEPKDLFVKKINDLDYVFAKVTTGGKNISDLLSNILPNSIRSTSGEKFMTWGNYDEKFARPIRWIVALIDNKVINFKYANINSDKYTFGHRNLNSKNIKAEITESSKYEEILKTLFVQCNPESRKQFIYKNLLLKKCTELNATLSDNPNNLLETVINITESPGVIVCEFDSEFLSLPAKVIETVLEKHQKYFVLYDKSKNILPEFLVITNCNELNNQDTTKNIKRGNEKVVRARLNDAKFFMEEDLKLPFNYEARIETLSKVTYQKGLGAMKEKVERITKLSVFIYNLLSSQNKTLKCTKEDVMQTAKLCKLDLTTHMVFEMPELQGIIGSIYARKNHIKEEICKGIQEHYSNPDPNNTIAQIIGLADRLDNIICLFSINKIPTGSTDPFALRSQTHWLFINIEAIQDHYNVVFDLSMIMESFRDNIADDNLKSKTTNETISKVKEFLTERLKLNYFVHAPIQDLTDAVFATGAPLTNLYLTRDKLKLLYKDFKKLTEENKAFLIAAKRLVRIIEPNVSNDLDTNVLKSQEEQTLLKLFEEMNKGKYKNIDEYYNSLKRLTEPINNFFDKILVNDPDIKIKNARQALLKKGKTLLEKICDFNQIVERN